MSKFVKDLAERVAIVALLAFLSTFNFSDLSTLRSAAVAGGAAAAQFVVGILSRRYGDNESAGIVK